jgi:alanyl-tRNA synthetase
MALRLDREKALSGENRHLRAELANAAADHLAAGNEAVMWSYWHNRDMAFLQELSKALVSRAPDRVALLAAGPRDDGFFLIVAAEETGVDLAATGAEVAAILGGRGGGRAPFFQGKATELGRFDEAVEYLCRTFNVQR